ncbi:MAG: DUF192 domain-containing protein [Candidatus Levyibacteriota bacterium]
MRGGNFSFGLLSGGATAKINDKTYKLLVAKTQADQIKGLSGRDSLPADTGMLFVFSQKGIYPFWMKNMKFPIDIIFINDNKIVDLFENAQVPAAGTPDVEIQKYRPSQPGNYVLELNAFEIAKQKIKKGDTVTLKGI